MDAEILNKALEFALEWGENFHKPIRDRLCATYPSVSAEEAEELDANCREIIRYAFEQIERAYLKEIPSEAATADILSKYPLINADRMASLWSQGQYYAWHDNG